MLIKEYRIPLPLTVEEYKIAQLYMIAVSEEFFLNVDNITISLLILSIYTLHHLIFPFRKKVEKRQKVQEVG